MLEVAAIGGVLAPVVVFSLAKRRFGYEAVLFVLGVCITYGSYVAAGVKIWP